jgi:hypothetical protein
LNKSLSIRFLATACIVWLCSVFTNAQQISFSGNTGNIPNTNTWALFACTVSGLPQVNINNTYGFEKITLSIAHNNVMDLEVHLVSPDGTDVLLFDGVGWFKPTHHGTNTRGSGS